MVSRHWTRAAVRTAEDLDEVEASLQRLAKKGGL